MRLSQGLGEHGNNAIYFRGTRVQRSKNEANRGTKAILGNREQRKSRFQFRGTGEQSDLFQGNKGNRYIHLEGILNKKACK